MKEGFTTLGPWSAPKSLINLNVAKAGGLQSQGVKGDTVVGYRESLTTQDLKSSGFPEGERTWQNRPHPSCPVVARRAKSGEFTNGDIRKMVFAL